MNVHKPDPAIDQHQSEPGGQSPVTSLATIMLPMNITILNVIYPHAGANARIVNTIERTYEIYMGVFHHLYARYLQ